MSKLFWKGAVACYAVTVFLDMCIGLGEPTVLHFLIMAVHSVTLIYCYKMVRRA